MSQDVPEFARSSTTGHRKERLVHALFLFCAGLSIVTTAAIILALVGDAVTFFTEVSPVDFYTGTKWSPNLKVDGSFRYGVLPLVTNTLAVTFGAALVALPVGLASAIYLSEYASDRVREVIKPALEVLAGIPTVVYGYFALVYLTPAIDSVVEVSGFNAISASLIVGVMIIPMVSSISEDAMNAVPDDLREASYGLGATKFTVSTTVVVPAAASGIFSSFILALSRAIGETMAVTIAGGANPTLITPFNFTEAIRGPIETMTAAMVNIGLGDVSANSTQYRSLFAIGITLFAITLAMNLLSQYVSSRYREVYD